MTDPSDGFGEQPYPGQSQQGQPQAGQPQAGQPQGGQPQAGYPGAGGPPPGGFGAQAGPPPKKKRTGLFIGLGVLALVVLGVLAAVVVLTVQGRTPLASDDKKIEVAIRDFYDTLDSDGFIAASELACAADRAEIENLTPEQRRQFDTATVSVRIDDVRDIVVTGDDAEATVVGQLTLSVEGEEPDTEDSTEEHLTKEDGTWKICSAPANKH
ncbi:Rv0361 family membrane protein [Nocardia sp. NPDC003979]